MQQKHNALLILDFDHTLFNTTKFVEALKQSFKKNFNIDSDHFTNHRNQIKECNSIIDIDNFVEAIMKEDNLDKEQLHNAIHHIIKTQAHTFIFLDVPDFLERHKTNFDILISTHGDCELQTEKITHSRLPDYVDHIISTKTKDDILNNYIKQYPNVYFIDDKAKNIDDVKKSHPSVITYFLRRPDDMPYGNTQSTCDCADKTITNLNFTIK